MKKHQPYPYKREQSGPDSFTHANLDTHSAKKYNLDRVTQVGCFVWGHDTWPKRLLLHFEFVTKNTLQENNNTIAKAIRIGNSCIHLVVLLIHKKLSLAFNTASDALIA